MAIVTPAVMRGLQPSLDDAARDVQMVLRKARADAVTQARGVAVWLDVASLDYGLEGGLTETLPEAFTAEAKVAAVETRATRAAIRFFPDGSSTGGHFRLGYEGAHVDIDVDWLTGRVSLAPAEGGGR